MTIRTALTNALLAGTLLVPLAACSTDESTTSTAGTPTDAETTTATQTSEAETSPLEGTWTTDITREAVIAYIREAGWGKLAEKALLDPQMTGPDQTEFRIDFVGDRFRMAQVSTDAQWQSGTFRIEGDRIYLDDEAPVGELTFRLTLDGDRATYDKPDDTSGDGEFMPGVPNWAPGAVMWASTTWVRADG
jgi:hypothetical protein